MLVHYLKNLYLCCGVKGQTGVIQGQRVQGIIFSKHAVTFSCHIAWLWNSNMCISLRSSNYFVKLEVNLGSFGVTGVIFNVSTTHGSSSSSSSSSSSVNISKSYISDMAWPILTRLGHKYRLTIPFMSHDQIRVKGHVGVTGVKKVIFTKNATLSTNYVAWSCNLCMW